jgi:hypothetical protein
MPSATNRDPVDQIELFSRVLRQVGEAQGLPFLDGDQPGG